MLHLASTNSLSATTIQQARLEDGFDFTTDQALNSPGFLTSARAILFSNQLGKRESDFSSLIDIGAGRSVAVGSDGRVSGAFGYDSGFQVGVTNLLAQFTGFLDNLVAGGFGVDAAETANTVGFSPINTAGNILFGTVAWPIIR